MTDRYLPDFEDMEVERATVRITRAGDGLSEALQIAPKALSIDEEVFYVLKGRVTQVNHREIEEKINGERVNVLVRVHTVEALSITEVEETYARKPLDKAAATIAKARAEAAGQHQLIEDEDPAA